MGRRAKLVLWTGGGLLAAVLLAVAIAVVVLSRNDWQRVRTALAVTAGGVLGRDVRLDGPLVFDPGWPRTRIDLRDITIASRPGEAPPHLLHVDRLQAAIDLRRLLGGDLVLPELVVDAPDLQLEKDADGHANWRLPPGPDPAPESRQEIPIIEHLRIDAGHLRYRDRARDVDLDMRLARASGSADERAPRIALDGRGTLRGQALEFHVSGGSLDALRETNAPYPLAGRITAGATKARFEGSVRDPVDARGFDLELTVAGASADDLYALTGIALLPTPPYRVKGRLKQLRGTWHFDDFSGRMGSSDLAGSLRWRPAEPRSRLTARFVSQRLALADLGPLIGLDPSKEADDGRVLPDMPLALERLRSMDADVVFDGARIVARGQPLSDFHLRLLLDAGVLRVSPVRFTRDAGAFETWATIDGMREPPRVDLKSQLRALPLEPLFAATAQALNEPNVAAGSIDGAGELRGHGRSLREVLAQADGRVHVQVIGGQLSQIVIEMIGLDVAETLGFLVRGDRPVPIRCMLADFDVADGRLAPHALVLDTTDTVVTGSGSIALDSERLDLRLSPEPKDFSPLSLRAPLTIEGTLAAPEFGVAKGSLVARGAAAIALALAFPPAAIAALFEPGTGDDANCAALLARAREESKPQKD